MSNCTIHRHATFEEVVSSALLVVAQGQVSDERARAERAIDHADACQEMVNDLFTPADGAKLTVIDGGASA